MTTVEAPAEAVQADPTETNASDVLAEETIAMIGGNRDFAGMNARQQAAYEKVTQAQAAAEHVEATTEAEPTEQTEEKADAELEAEETAAAEAEAALEAERAAEEAKATKGAPSRFRFKDAEDRVVAQLALAKGISLVKAAELYAKLNEPEKVEEAAAQVAPPIITSPTVQALETQVATLEAQMETFVDGIHTAESIKATKDYAKTVAALERARSEAQQEAIAEQSFESQRNAVFAETVKAFPDMNDHESPQYLIAASLANQAANDPKHVDHEASKGLNAPRYFAEKAAAKLKLKPAATTTVKPVVVQAPAKPRVTPANGNRSTQPAARQPTETIEELQARTRNIISGGGHGRTESNTILIN